MTYVFGKDGHKLRRYNVYIRLQAAYTRPTDQSALTTLLGEFTKIGEIEDQNAKLDIEDANSAVLGDGNTHGVGKKGVMELKHLNNTTANIDDLESTYDNKDCDFLFHDPYDESVVVWKDFTPHLKINRNSGTPTLVMIGGEKIVPATSDLEDRFDEPVS